MTLNEQHIARAYAKLSCIPEDGSEASVSLASILNFANSTYSKVESDLDGIPLFWLELFDHGTKMSIDSFRCHNIKEAAPVFEYFKSQAAYVNNPGPGGAERPSSNEFHRAPR